MTTNTASKLGVICDRITDALCTETVFNQPNNLKWLCSICNKNVTSSMKGMQCDTCNKWCHIRCDCMTVEEYEYYTSTNNDDSVGWNCLFCSIKLNNENLAFTLVGNEEILKINNSDSMSFFLPWNKFLKQIDI